MMQRPHDDPIPWKPFTTQNMVQILKDFSDQKNDIYKLAIQYEILLTYLGRDWWKTRCNAGVPPSITSAGTAYDPFFEPGSEASPQRALYFFRTMMLADSIYILRNIHSFPNWAKRLRQKDLEAAFCEAWAARLFYGHGYQSKFHAQTGIKGQDYDFRIGRGECEFAVEVKSKRNETPLSDRTVYRSSLKPAGDSLPKGERGIVVLFIPEAWLGDCRLKGTVENSIQHLFRGFRRVHYVILCWFELHHVDSTTTFYLSRACSYKNHSAGCPDGFVDPLDGNEILSTIFWEDFCALRKNVDGYASDPAW